MDYEDGQTGNFSTIIESKIELVVKSIISIQQIEFISVMIGEEQNGGFKSLIRELICSNTSHLSYMINYY